MGTPGAHDGCIHLSFFEDCNGVLFQWSSANGVMFGRAAGNWNHALHRSALHYPSGNTDGGCHWENLLDAGAKAHPRRTVVAMA